MKNGIGESMLAGFLGLAVVAAGAATFLLWRESGKGPHWDQGTKSEVVQETSSIPASDYYETDLSGFILTTGDFVEGGEITETDEDYILSFSSERPVELSDLMGFDVMALRLARNEIYARHGRIFEDEYLKSYFESRDWYFPIYSSDDFPESLLSELEKENATFIGNYEKEINQ